MAKAPTLLMGIDAGTTHCKAALFTPQGGLVAQANRLMQSRRDESGAAIFDSEDFWQTVVDTIVEAVAKAGRHRLSAIGVSSMAESGLLIDQRDGRPLTGIIPWFDISANNQAIRLEKEAGRQAGFLRSGIYPSFKCSLAKILWLRDVRGISTENALWLSAADYIVYRLTGAAATDYSLATRTYAFDINARAWDAAFLRQFDLSPNLFPEVLPAGTIVGNVTPDMSRAGNLLPGVPVSVCGHDHVCGAFAVGAAEPGIIFDSMGTAEAFMGFMPLTQLGLPEYESGLTFGCHVARNRNYWMGGLSTSGGSVEWLRRLLADPSLTYEQFESLVSSAPDQPTGILYFPYLAGSGSPNSDPLARAAFVGLSAAHSRPDLARAVMEGTAFEMETDRLAAVRVTGQSVRRMVAAGGGTRSRTWLQIKADVSGCQIEVPMVDETTLLGAALLAGIGSGLFANEEEALAGPMQVERRMIQPNLENRALYLKLFTNGYQQLQEPLRRFYRYRFEESIS